MNQPFGRGSLDYAQSKGDAQRPTMEAHRAAALDLNLWIPRIFDVEQPTIEILMNVHHIRTGARTIADVIFDLCEGQHSPPPTMEHPGQWRHVATRLMVRMGPTSQMT